MRAVLLKRQGCEDHSYRIYGAIGDSLTLWHILETPALAFLHRLKREHAGLAFEVTVQIIHSYVNDGFVPEMAFTILSSHDPDLAQSLFQQCIDTHAYLVTGQPRERGGAYARTCP